MLQKDDTPAEADDSKNNGKLLQVLDINIRPKFNSLPRSR
mgnify:CR=1 FL=1